ncbi:hypothetical protein DSO57_1011085 [Entomophthora muscae]|uniref:Uncharacterized protein n=1 Tax=Entomophthora muscae TaxID=34485 RepID=A0ACC2SJ89_9FUNG|nr:hypothetical protein DSO57_1011085 [Entomophthora muscae]
MTHAKGASKWAVKAYKDAQLIHLDLVSLSGVYSVNSIELVWDVLEMLPFKNILKMGQAHAAACFSFPMEHTVREGAKLTKFGSHPRGRIHQDTIQCKTDMTA